MPSSTNCKVYNLYKDCFSCFMHVLCALFVHWNMIGLCGQTKVWYCICPSWTHIILHLWLRHVERLKKFILNQWSFLSANFQKQSFAQNIREILFCPSMKWCHTITWHLLLDGLPMTCGRVMNLTFIFLTKALSQVRGRKICNETPQM